MNVCIYQTNGLVVFMIYKMKKELFLPLFCLATATKRSTQLGLSIAQLIKILRENTS